VARRVTNSGYPKEFLALFAVVCAAHLATLLIGIGSFWHADELIQYIEQPYRVLHGLPLSAWEYQTGTRNWLFPGTVLGLLAGLEMIGIGNPLVVLVLLRLVTKMLFGAAWVRLATVAYANDESREWQQFLPVALVGLFPVMLFASNHTLSEVWSLIPLLWGVAEWQAALSGKPQRARYAGMFFGIAILVRLQVAALVAPLVLLSWWQNRKGAGSRSIANAAVYGTITLLAGALLDAITYGSFGHSLIANLTAHFGDGGSLFAVMGRQPWHFLVSETIRLAPLAVVAMGPLFLVGFWRAPRSPFAWSVILFVAIHSAIPHKELRFLLPALPFALLVAGEGLIWLLEVLTPKVGRWGQVPLLLLVAALLIPHGVRLAAVDEADAQVTQKLSQVSELPGKPIVVTDTPGRTIWPAESRFVVGVETRTMPLSPALVLAAICQSSPSHPLLLFGADSQIALQISPWRAAGCDPRLLESTGPWMLLRLR